jgi:hypothetical protein
MTTRDSQIKNHKKNQNSVDFNAHNYDIEELAAILKFEHTPINKPIIERRIMELKRKFEGQEKYAKFFDEAKKRLIENLELVNEPTWEDTYTRENSAAAKELQQQFQEENEKEKKEQINQIINKAKNIIGIPKITLQENFKTNDVTQGTKNPLRISEIKRLVNFDSHYRQILDPSSVACTGEFNNISNSEDRLYTSTNYIVTLDTQLSNVIDITVDSVEIPNSWYTFSDDYGTSSFSLKYLNTTTITIKIKNGNYTKQGLVDAINKKIWDTVDIYGNHQLRGYFDNSGNYTTNSSDYSSSKLPFPRLKLEFDDNDDKISVYNYDPIYNLVINWYDNTEAEVCSAEQASETPKPGGKVDYNLGWLMGYRKQTSIIKPHIYDKVVDADTFTGWDFSSTHGTLTSTTFNGYDFSTGPTNYSYTAAQFVPYIFTYTDVGDFQIIVENINYHTYLWTDCSTIANAIYAINNAFSVYNVPATASPEYASGIGMVIKLTCNNAGSSKSLAVNDNSSPDVLALFDLSANPSSGTYVSGADATEESLIVNVDGSQQIILLNSNYTTTTSVAGILINGASVTSISSSSIKITSNSTGPSSTVTIQPSSGTNAKALFGGSNSVSGNNLANESLIVEVNGVTETILLNSNYPTAASATGILIPGASVTLNGSNLKITADITGTNSATSGIQIQPMSSGTNAKNLFGAVSGVVYSKRDIHSCRWQGNHTSSILSPDSLLNVSSQTPPGGAIIPLVWFVILSHEEYYYGKNVPQSTVDVKGPQYFMITLDDYNNNKPNKDLISFADNTTRDFKIPGYFNTQTMDKRYGLGKYYTDMSGVQGYECQDIADTGNNSRGCFNGKLNKDISGNLTKAQKYTYEQIMAARNRKGVDVYSSPNATDLLSRFSVNRDAMDHNKSIIYKNNDKDLTKRRYFGPVKLVKFKVRLLNDKGFEVNLNGRDWSFNIVVTQLYQY